MRQDKLGPADSSFRIGIVNERRRGLDLGIKIEDRQQFLGESRVGKGMVLGDGDDFRRGFVRRQQAGPCQFGGVV